MSDFKGFSEAARLYAENAAVVEAMHRAFTESVRQFLDYLSGEVNRLLAPERLSESAKGKYRYWRIGEAHSDSNREPCFFFNQDLPDLIVPGELWFGVGADQVTEDQLTRMHALADDPDLKPYVEGHSRYKWNVLSGKVPYPRDNPVEVVAPVLATILRKVTAHWESAAARAPEADAGAGGE
jgi:hypothetical protein